MNEASIITFVTMVAIHAIPVLLAITIHESAHGYAARYFGDTTAAAQGRITLNPLAHIDLVGTIILPLVLLIATGGKFAFGYAKPVPVNFARLRNPKRDMLWVALAGPVSNLIQAVLWALLLVALIKMGVTEKFFIMMAFAGITVNLVLCILNLFPIPPLDGGRVLVSLLPYKAARTVAQIEPYGFMIVMGLVILNVLSVYWISPLMNVALDLLQALIFTPMGIRVV